MGRFLCFTVTTVHTLRLRRTGRQQVGTYDPTLSASRRSLWASRDYVLLWSGQAVSSIGSQLSLFAFPLLMLAVTGSAAQAGFLTAARTIPYLLLGLPAGAVVDRVDRKRLMIACDAGRAVVLASIPFAAALDHLTLAQLYIVAVVEGTLNVFFNLASTAALVHVVPKEQLHAAASVDEMTLSAGTLIGPALGGFVYGLGRAIPFFLDAVTYAVSVVTLQSIHARLSDERPPKASVHLWGDIREGLTWLRRQPLLRFLALLVGGGLLVEAGYLLGVIVLAQRMGASSAVIGLVLGTGGIGSVLGAIAAAPIQRRLTFGQIALGVHWLWALALPLYAVAPNPAALAGITFVAFGAFPVFGVAQFTYRLGLIPGDLQGRVNSVFRLLLYGAQAAGAGIAGVLIQRLGPRQAILCFAAVLVALALAATLNPRMRTAGKVATESTS
jgi:predicted MFS family arabinose efflux permease